MKKTVLLSVIFLIFAALLVSCALTEQKGTETDTQSGTATVAPAPTAATESGGTEPAPQTEGPTSAATDEPSTETEPATEPPASETAAPNGPPPIDYDVNAHLGSKRVIIDAGHGFADPGCTSEYLGGVYERDICYEMATLLASELEDRGYEPVLLRGTDTFPSASELEATAKELNMFYREGELVDNYIFSAYERTLWANIIHRREPVALMVSLHINALPDYDYIRGTELYFTVDNGCAEPSGKLAGFIETKLREAFPDVRLKKEGCPWNDSYIVTKWTEMPSVLVEMAYATNEDDAKLILDNEWREKYIGALADAIEGYIETR